MPIVLPLKGVVCELCYFYLLTTQYIRLHSHLTSMPSDAFHCVAHFNVEIRAAIELVTVRATDVGLGRVHAPTATTFPCTAFSVTIR